MIESLTNGLFEHRARFRLVPWVPSDVIYWSRDPPPLFPAPCIWIANTLGADDDAKWDLNEIFFFTLFDLVKRLKKVVIK